MESHDENFPTSAEFDISILNSIVDPIAVLDENGIIRAVNDAWIQFATQNGGSAVASETVGQNYLTVCENATGGRVDCEANAALSGLKAVLSGDLPEFHLDYACHSPSEQRWFHMRIVPLNVQSRRRGA
ncbi:MAG: histidine kinase, partial [Phycisphaerae bacterium]